MGAPYIYDISRLRVNIRKPVTSLLLMAVRVQDFLTMERKVQGRILGSSPVVCTRTFRCLFLFPRGVTAPGGPGPPYYPGFTITLDKTHHTR